MGNTLTLIDRQEILGLRGFHVPLVASAQPLGTVLGATLESKS